MVSSTIDHMVAVTVFLAATLLFIGLFNQTIQTAVIYQRHKATAAKASDLLDTMLLSPGIPVNWGQLNGTPTGFGIQDPEFTQYKLSPYSLMRLTSFSGTPVYYPRTGTTYSNITMGFGNFLLVSSTQSINYSTASRLLGINGKYGFQLTISPIITVSVTKISSGTPLRLSINVAGAGSSLPYAPISYCFLLVNKGDSQYPSFTTVYGSTYTNAAGSVELEFSGIDGESYSYTLIAYAGISGLKGAGYYTHISEDLAEYVVPMVDSFEDRRVLIAHSWAVNEPPDKISQSELKYNATFVILADDFTLREVPIGVGKVGHVVYGQGTEKAYGNITIPTYNPGILVVTYRKSATQYGAVMMPWGLSAMAFPVTFGGDPSQQEWVATDMRHVTVGGIAYQAKLALWSLEGYQVIN